MEDVPRDFHRPERFTVPLTLSPKPALTFSCWAEEAVYLRLPTDPDLAKSTADLCVRLAYSQRGRRDQLTPQDIANAIERLTRLVDGYRLVEMFQDGGDWFVRRTAIDRSIVLQYVL